MTRLECGKVDVPQVREGGGPLTVRDWVAGDYELASHADLG